MWLKVKVEIKSCSILLLNYNQILDTESEVEAKRFVISLIYLSKYESFMSLPLLFYKRISYSSQSQYD